MQKDAPKMICAACSYKTDYKFNYRRHRASHACFLRRHRFPQDIVRLIMCFAREELLMEHVHFISKYDIICDPTDSTHDLSFYIRRHRRLHGSRTGLTSTPLLSREQSVARLRSLVRAVLAAAYRLLFHYS
jgi:hypothetical protein